VLEDLVEIRLVKKDRLAKNEGATPFNPFPMFFISTISCM